MIPLLDFPGRQGQWPLGFPLLDFPGVQVNGPWVSLRTQFGGYGGEVGDQDQEGGAEDNQNQQGGDDLVRLINASLVRLMADEGT